MYSATLILYAFSIFVKGYIYGMIAGQYLRVYLNVFDLSCRLIDEIEGIMFVFSLVGAFSFFDSYGKI